MKTLEWNNENIFFFVSIVSMVIHEGDQEMIYKEFIIQTSWGHNNTLTFVKQLFNFKIDSRVIIKFLEQSKNKLRQLISIKKIILLRTVIIIYLFFKDLLHSNVKMCNKICL